MSGPLAAARSLLTREKVRDYRNTVILQITILTVQLLLEDLLTLVGLTPPMALLRPLFYGLSGIYLLFLWDLFRNFQPARWLLRGSQVALILAFGTLVLLDVVWASGEYSKQGWRLASHLAIFGFQVAVISAALKDLFEGPRESADKLWGSACIYFMTGFAFAGFYYCVFLINPLAFGKQLDASAWGFFEALYLSMTTLIGLDNIYGDAIRLVRNATLVEGTWGQLYLVLLIGRLLAPESEETPQPSSSD